MALTHQRDFDFYKALAGLFPSAGGSAVNHDDLLNRYGIRREEYFDMESGQNMERLNYPSRDAMLQYQAALAMGGDPLDIFNQRVPQEFRDALIDFRNFQPVTGANYELYDPRTGERIFHNEFFDLHGVGLPESVAKRYPQFAGSNHGITVPNQTSDGDHAVDLTWRPAVNKEAAGLLRGDDLGIGEFAPLAVMAMMGAHFGGVPGFGGEAAAGLGEAVSGTYGATASELANAAASYGGGLGSASAGGTASGLESLVGPATGAVESAPVINTAAGPTVSAVASGAGPFIPTIPGIPGLSQALSSVLDNASGGGTAASLANSLTQPTGGGSLMDILTKLGPSLAGAYASSQQADAIRELYNQSRADREPFRQKAIGYLNDPNSYITGPGATALDGVLRRLSVGGNPVGDPAKLGIATSAAMNDWRNAVTGFGNLGLAGEDTRANLGMGAINADANVWNALGAGADKVLNPQPSLYDHFKRMRQEGLI